jgi:hypothetical protein
MFSHGALFERSLSNAPPYTRACTGWNVLGRLACKAENGRQLNMLHYECSHSETDCSGECYGEYREPHLALLSPAGGSAIGLSVTGACYDDYRPVIPSACTLPKALSMQFVRIRVAAWRLCAVHSVRRCEHTVRN